MSESPRSAMAVALVLFGCSASPSRQSSPESAPTRAARVEASSKMRLGPSEVPPGATVRDEPAAPAALPFAFKRIDATPVRSVAVGKPPKIAFLARGEALVFSAKGLERMAAPETREPDLSVEIFFGRDDQPRLMGHRPAGERVEPYYRRFKGGRFQAEPGELGPLAAPAGALYGVLGHADPEVVCRPRQFCLVKRTTGWGRAPAHDQPVRVVLSGGTAWALHRDRIERLERDAWATVEPDRAFHEPLSVFADASGSLFVVEAERDAIARLANGRWEAIPTPLRGPRAIWGSSAMDVWLVGAGGAAHFDGNAWRVAADVAGQIEHVAYAAPDLWLAGDGGIFRGTPTMPK